MTSARRAADRRRTAARRSAPRRGRPPPNRDRCGGRSAGCAPARATCTRPCRAPGRTPTSGSAALAMPKSDSFTSPCAEQRMFEGETSRWMMASDAPFGVAAGVRVGEARPASRARCAARPPATARGGAASRGGMIVRRSTPRTYSMTMNSDSSDSTRSKVWTMLAWSSVAEIFASRKNRSRNSGRGGVLGQQLLEHDLLLEAAGPQLLADVDRAHPAFGQVALDAVAAGGASARRWRSSRSRVGSRTRKIQLGSPPDTMPVHSSSALQALQKRRLDGERQAETALAGALGRPPAGGGARRGARGGCGGSAIGLGGGPVGRPAADDRRGSGRSIPVLGAAWRRRSKPRSGPETPTGPEL